MAKPFVTPIDLTGNEVQNARVHNRGVDPTGLTAANKGLFWIDGAGLFKYWDGTQVVTLGTAGSGGPPSGAAGGELAGTYPNPTIADGVIDNANIAAGAAIAKSKLAALNIADADIAAGAAISLAKLAVDPLARANHTGTQLSGTISDFHTAVRTNRLDQMAAPTAAVSLSGQKLTNLADPTVNQDGATKIYVDNAVAAARAGLSIKDPVRVASTANVNIATGGLLTIDGVTVVAGDRVLLKDQTTASENGIYVAAAGAWTRATDADTSAEVPPGTSVWVNEGTANGDSRWTLQTNGPITLGTTGLSFVMDFRAIPSTAGAGLTATGGVLSVGAGTGIVVAADAVSIDTAVVTRTVVAQIGNGAATTFAVTHNLGKQWVNVDVYRNSAPFDKVETEVQATDANTVTILGFTTAPTTNQYRVVISG